MADLFVQVAIPVPLRQVFTYIVPNALHNNDIDIGERVVVPFGPRKVVGVILSQEQHCEIEKLKPIISRVSDKYIFDKSLLKLLTTASRYYHHPIGDVMQQALPVPLRDINQPTITPEIEYIANLDCSPDQVTRDKLSKKAPKQEQLLATVEHGNGITWPELRTLGFSKSQINSLIKKDYIEDRPRADTPFVWQPKSLNAEDKLALNPEQAADVEKLLEKIEEDDDVQNVYHTMDESSSETN